jgi:competence protein ComEA
MNTLISNTGLTQELGAMQTGRGSLSLVMGFTSTLATADEPININLASAEVMAEALHGVGITKAQRIIEYREAHGPFEHIEELAAVRGIGLDTVEKNRDVIRLQ